MACITPITTQCSPCIHPLEYLFELANVTSSGPNNIASFVDALEGILTRGISMPKCKYCCPDCNGLYILASVETFLKVYIEITAVPNVFYDQLNKCCVNNFTSVETYLNLIEFGGTQALPIRPEYSSILDLKSCCNKFDECIDKLICWSKTDASVASFVNEALQAKGVVEYGSINNNCSDANVSSLCTFVNLLERYKNISLDTSKLNIILTLFDIGIVISCGPNDEIIIASYETWLQYFSEI